MKRMIILFLLLASFAVAQDIPPIGLPDGSMPPESSDKGGNSNSATPAPEATKSVPTPTPTVESTPTPEAASAGTSTTDASTESQQAQQSVPPSASIGAAPEAINPDESAQVVQVPHSHSPVKNAYIDKQNEVRLKIPTEDGTDVFVTVDRDNLMNQLGNYSQARNSYEFDHTPIVDVLTNLAILMNKSFEAPPSLAGDGSSPTPAKYLVTGIYKDMTPMQVFYRVAKAYGLRIRQEGNVLRVFREEDENLSEMEVVVYHTKYVNLYNYLDSIKSFLSPKGRLAVNALNHQGKLDIDPATGNVRNGIDTKLLYGPINSGDPNPVKLGSSSSSSSSGGGGSDVSASLNASGDKDTTDAVLPNNSFSITVFDIPEVQSVIQEFLDSVDKPKRQIAIQMRLYDFANSPTKEYGLDWASILNNPSQAYNLLKLNIGTKEGVPLDTSSNLPDKQFLSFLNGFRALAPGSVLISPDSLNLALKLIQSDSYAQQISAPNAIAQHGQTTFLRSLTRRPIIVGSTTNSQNSGGSSTSSSVQFITTGTVLNVTPFIMDDTDPNPKNWELYLDLRPEITREGQLSTLPGVGQIPVVLAVAPTTSVRMKNGDTVLIGGLTSNSFTKTDEGIPVLKDLPVLDWLFGTHSTNKNEDEMVILVTAKIIDSGQKVMPDVTQVKLAEMINQDDHRDHMRTVPEQSKMDIDLKKQAEEEREQRSKEAKVDEDYSGVKKTTLVNPSQDSGVEEASNAPGKGETSISYMRSPFAPDAGLIDVSGYKSGDKVKDPYTGKIFVVP